MLLYAKGSTSATLQGSIFQEVIIVHFRVSQPGNLMVKVVQGSLVVHLWSD